MFVLKRTIMWVVTGFYLFLALMGFDASSAAEEIDIGNKSEIPHFESLDEIFSGIYLEKFTRGSTPPVDLRHVEKYAKQWSPTAKLIEITDAAFLLNRHGFLDGLASFYVFRTNNSLLIVLYGDSSVLGARVIENPSSRWLALDGFSEKVKTQWSPGPPIGGVVRFMHNNGHGYLVQFSELGLDPFLNRVSAFPEEQVWENRDRGWLWFVFHDYTLTREDIERWPEVSEALREIDGTAPSGHSKTMLRVYESGDRFWVRPPVSPILRQP